MMSGKKKSRSILSLPNITAKTKSQNTIQNSFDECLGEKIKDEPGTPINSLSASSDFEGILDLGIRISGLSSSSSLSWSEEYESEIAKKVQGELEKLDNIFQGLETDPSPYDIKEIQEWKQYFPHLRILGHNTPTNSVENSDASTSSEDEILIIPEHRNFGHRHAVFPRNRSSLVNEKWPALATQDILNPIRNYKLPWKPRSLEINQYLKISSLKSSDARNRKQVPQSICTRQTSRDLTGDVSPEYTSLPFITATPLITHIRKRNERNKPSKMLILPPIENTFRSISATPRQTSSKSMYESLNYERNSSKKDSRAVNLKSELMKLFDQIPVSNR